MEVLTRLENTKSRGKKNDYCLLSFLLNAKLSVGVSLHSGKMLRLQLDWPLYQNIRLCSDRIIQFRIWVFEYYLKMHFGILQEKKGIPNAHFIFS